MKRIFVPIFALTLIAGSWFGYGQFLRASMPKIEVLATSGLPINGDKTLPFYELMSPLPAVHSQQLLPRLEYKKGPPERFIEKISLLVQSGTRDPKERVVYHGRRTRTDFHGLALSGLDEAHYLETAIRLSQGEPSPLHTGIDFLLRPLLLREAQTWLKNVKAVHIMDQAGSPAFLFEGVPSAEGRIKSTALFIRRSSLYRVDYLADRGFRHLDPEQLFRKSFLTERRADALEYLAKNLSEVRLEKNGVRDFGSIAWPILLLAANVSVDPSSLEAYFHFAGISALLYRSASMDKWDSETLDILRSNVLASEFYAKDVSPQSAKTAEISRLARLLTRNFE
jgi:hypothetical protein